jgi:hypothetical protein
MLSGDANRGNIKEDGDGKEEGMKDVKSAGRQEEREKKKGTKMAAGGRHTTALLRDQASSPQAWKRCGRSLSLHY